MKYFTTVRTTTTVQLQDSEFNVIFEADLICNKEFITKEIIETATIMAGKEYFCIDMISFNSDVLKMC